MDPRIKDQTMIQGLTVSNPHVFLHPKEFSSMKSRSMIAALLLVSVLGSSAVQAQATAKLPKAETVLDQYVEATGGKAAYEKVKNRVATGTLDISGANIKGKLTITQAEPGKLLNETDLGQAGKSTQGTDGEVVWETSTFTGERILEGEEKATFLKQATFNSEIHWKDRYEKVECTGVEDVEGKPAYKLTLTPKEGKPVVEYYDVDSHLMVKQTVTSKTPMGEIKVDVYPGQYKKVDGILIPFQAKQKVLGQEIVMTIEEIKHNVDLPKDTFAPPKAVMDALKKKK